VVAPLLLEGQTFLVAGGYDQGPFENKARILTRRDGKILIQVGDEYLSNHPKADTWAWFHVTRCPCEVITVYSPDSDVLMVGLLTIKNWKEALAGGVRRERRVFL
jgi:hypothetical protein